MKFLTQLSKTRESSV